MADADHFIILYIDALGACGRRDLIAMKKPWHANRFAFGKVVLGLLTLWWWLVMNTKLNPASSSNARPAEPSQLIHVPLNGEDFTIVVKTKTQPSFLISLHREREDVPRAGILYTGLYYEHEKTDQFRMLIETIPSLRKGVFLDVGANIGWFSLYAAEMGMSVIAFEPDASNLQKLRQSIYVNSFLNILLLPYGAGAGYARIPFGQVESNKGMGGFERPSGETRGTINHEATQALQVVPIDDQIANAKAPWNAPITLAKIDVEGFEAEVLMGSLGTLRRYLPLVYIELTCGVQDEEYYKTMYKFLSLGYRVYKQNLTWPVDYGEMKRWLTEHMKDCTNPWDVLVLPDWISDGDVPF